MLLLASLKISANADNSAPNLQSNTAVQSSSVSVSKLRMATLGNENIQQNPIGFIAGKRIVLARYDESFIGLHVHGAPSLNQDNRLYISAMIVTNPDGTGKEIKGIGLSFEQNMHGTNIKNVSGNLTYVDYADIQAMQQFIQKMIDDSKSTVRDPNDHSISSYKTNDNCELSIAHNGTKATTYSASYGGISSTAVTFRSADDLVTFQTYIGTCLSWLNSH